VSCFNPIITIVNLRLGETDAAASGVEDASLGAASNNYKKGTARGVVSLCLGHFKNRIDQNWGCWWCAGGVKGGGQF